MRHVPQASSVCIFCSALSTRSSAANPSSAWRWQRQYTRPSFAPKPTFNIKHIARNPGLYEQNCVDRNYKALSRNSWQILELTEQRRQAQHANDEYRRRNNAVQVELKSASGAHGPSDHERTPEQQAKFAQLVAEAKELKSRLAQVSVADAQREAQIIDLAAPLPNLSSVQTPNGSEPRIISTHLPSHPSTNPHARSHVDIGTTQLGLLDFAGAATTTGWGWYFLDGALADLEDALVQYALSVVRKRRGWTRAAPPSMVYSYIAEACGFQPRDQNGEMQSYGVQQRAGKDEHPRTLAATAEVPLAGRFAGTVFEEKRLPLKMVGVSRCFRAEAGARGVDTKGLYRVHEFTKVEMFAWTAPDHSADEEWNGPFETGDDASSRSCEEVFNEIVGIQKEILVGLGLPFRVLEMPATDLGASASRKIDMEVLFPSRAQLKEGEGWGEVTSVSICTDYQSRRLGARMKRKSEGTEFPYTVNGTALAVPRVLAAVLEHGWDEENNVVRVPQCLRPWMGGLEIIKSK